jgi:tRNA(fMet)-specific endonuclease VapC
LKIFDTDLLIAWLRGKSDARSFFQANESERATTTLNLAELFEGAALSRDPPGSLRAIEQLAATMPVVPFGPRHARAFGALNAARRKSRKPGGVIDILTASIAKAEGASLVTRNVKDYEGHDGIHIEKW